MFENRADAGDQLGAMLARENLHDPVVLALPRGGVPVGYEVRRHLHARFDVLVVRKVGAPGRPELGVGAICEGDVEVWDTSRLAALGLDEDDLHSTLTAERTELRRRVQHYRGDRALPELRGRTAVVVDDGLATGVTARAALRTVSNREAARVILAVPVGAPQTVQRLSGEAEIFCLRQPSGFRAVGRWYRDFGQTSDDEVLRLLRSGAREALAADADGGAPR